MARGGGMPAVNYSVTRLGGGVTGQGVTYPGGLDLTTPSLSLQPGALRGCVNYECAQSGGYSRIKGYERSDGRAAPSDAAYQIIQLVSFTNIPTAGQSVTQAVSGATGTIIAISNVTGSYYVAVTQVVGAFDYSHAISVGATPIGTATTPTTIVTPLVNAQYLAAAADVYRALIGAVPGSGNVTGVVGMAFSGLDNVYAFRPNVGGTAVALYKQSAAGWVLVPFFNSVSFSAGGIVEPADGTTLTQGGVTATIKRVMTQSGIWASSTAAGVFVVANPTGGNFSAGAATIGGVTVTLAGIQTAITLAPGGRFEFVKSNFSGQSATRRIYGCDGVNKAFEFDGETLAPITTGLTNDAPSHIASHKNMLFLSYQSSVIHSGIGVPFKYSALDGGGEIATGDVVTGMITMPGDQSSAALSVFQRSNTSILYGTSEADFNFVSLNTGAGALAYSAQNMFDTFVFDDLGVITLRATLNYGNFLSNTLTKNILPFVLQQRQKVTATACMRSKSQYRTFFSDGYALWLTMVNQQYLGPAIILFPNPVYCVDEGETITGDEFAYFGSNDGDGYVYQMEKGTSFDGESIDAYITLAWDAIKSPRILKRFRAASIEIQGTAYASVQFGYQLGYGSPNIGQPTAVEYPSNFSGAFWDQFTWDAFVWDGQTLSPTDVDVTGTAENIQVTITSTTNYIDAFTVNSIIHQYSSRRGMRV